MMDIIIRIIAFIGTIASLGGIVFILMSNFKMKNMQKINHGLDVYIKKKGYLLMKNDGEDLCETKEFDMPLFSQECDCIIRRKGL